MNQQKIQSYVHLIQKLLACPSGEEWIVLRQNEALVTPELVTVMEQVATQLANRGNLKEAKFLHNLAGQIYHLFSSQAVSPPEEEDKSPAYLELIQALLDCPEGSEGELLLANQELIGPSLVAMMQKVAVQLANNGNQQEADYLQKWAMELNRIWLEQHDFQPIPKQESAAGPEQFKAPADVPPSASTAQSTPPLPVEQPYPIDRTSILEDPWAEPLVEPQQQRSPLLEQSISNPPEPTPLSSLQTFTHQQQQPDMPLYEQINHHLETIAGALTKLSETLSTSVQPPTDPLWYMEALERAAAGKWILSSEEVKRLIGIQPSCAKDHNSFQRGSWVFVKAGKLGGQTAWKVEKVDETT